MFNRAFWAAALERAIKTAAQAIIGLWVVADGVFDILHVNWTQTFGIAAGMFVLSIITSIVSLPFGPAASPSVTEAR